MTQEPNAVYLGSLEVYSGGLTKRHKYALKGWEGFAEQVLGQWYFIPEGLRPIPETKQQADILRLVCQEKKLTDEEFEIWDEMLDSVTFRVRIEDIFLLS